MRRSWLSSRSCSTRLSSEPPIAAVPLLLLASSPLRCFEVTVYKQFNKAAAVLRRRISPVEKMLVCDSNRNSKAKMYLRPWPHNHTEGTSHLRHTSENCFQLALAQQRKCLWRLLCQALTGAEFSFLTRPPSPLGGSEVKKKNI